MRRAITALALTVGAGTACQDSSLPSRTRLDDPQFLTFRCVTGDQAVPVSGCGCMVPDPEGAILTDKGPVQTGFKELGRIACTCLEATPPEPGETNVSVIPVRYVEVDPAACVPLLDENGCQVDWDCEPTVDPETGDWISTGAPSGGSSQPGGNGCPSVPPRPDSIPCASEGGGELRAYVSAARRGEVALIDLSDDDTIEDVDPTIPGNTSIFVDDIITDVESHPTGEFVFTVNSSTGTLTVIDEDRLQPSHTVDLGLTSPILEALVTPSPMGALDAGWWLTPKRAYISVPKEGQILVLDVDALGNPSASLSDIILDTIQLADGVRPASLAADDDGLYLIVGHLEQPALTIVDLASPDRQQVAPLEPGTCDNGYLTGVISDLPAEGLCRDGLDNDGDGAVDAEDPDCAAGAGWEGPAADYLDDPSRAACPQRYECFDEVDNDGDGLVDALDTDCELASRWERPTPECANGEDDDGDGLVDALDPDCRDEGDGSEQGREVSTCADGLDNDGDGQADADDSDCVLPEACAGGLIGDVAAGCPADPLALPEEGSDSPCQDGEDNDGDGLTDSEDPGCRDLDASLRLAQERIPECADGVDNDGDGLVDYTDGDEADPDCYAASDDNEGGSAVMLGPTGLVATSVIADASLYHMAYALNRANGDVYRVSLPSDPSSLGAGPLPTRRIRLGLDLQRMTLRQIPGVADALLTIDDTGVLRSLEISDQVPLTDQDGRPIFARLGAFNRSDGGSLILSGQYYVVEDGVAYCVEYCAEQTLRPGVESASCPTIDELETCSGPDGGSHPLFELAVSSAADPLLPDNLQVEAALSDAAREGLRSLLPEGDALGVTVSLLDPDNPDADRDRGFRDPLVVLGGRRRLLEDQANVITTAQGRTNLVSTVPTFQLDDSTVRYERPRHTTFCRPDPTLAPGTYADRAARTVEDALVDGPCVPIGFEVDGTEESLQSSRTRTRYRADLYEGIQVLEEDPRRMVSDEFTLAYEGELPNSESRSGQYGPPYLSVDDEATATAETWTLLDYNRDLCDVGVEIGDVVLIDQLVPATDAAGQLTVCAELYAQLTAEPLRYRVVEVGEHRMVLAPDTREAYALQVARDERSALPTLTPTTTVPPYECAAQFIQYRVRAGHDLWLLSGARTGYRHPVINVGGQCVVDEARVSDGRVARAALGEVFENEFFRFRLGFLASGDEVISGIPESRLPFMVDAAYTFRTSLGRAHRSAQIVEGLAQEMRWLPLEDHLYVVDSAIGSVAEIIGLSVYTQTFRALPVFD